MTIIVQTTDLTDIDQASFEHAVGLAHAGGATLVSLHANADPERIVELPEPKSVLARWSKPADAVEFTKQVHNCCDDPVDTLLDALRKLEPDLIVTATHQRGPLARLLTGSRAEAIAHNVPIPTLLLPEKARPFVSTSTGELDLQRVVIPIGDPEAAKIAAARAAWLLDMAHVKETEIVLLHVGESSAAPRVELPDRPGWTVHLRNRADEDIEDAIVAEGGGACLLVMATRGHDSLGDVLLGSHTDRVLHRTQCPVLSVPIL